MLASGQWPLLCSCRPFCIFAGCLFSNPESCSSKQVRVFLLNIVPELCVGHFFANVAHFVFLRDVCFRTQRAAVASVADPNLDPDPPDPHVFGPPGSGSISQRYGLGFGSGSGSFYHQAKIIRKTLIPTAL